MDGAVMALALDLLLAVALVTCAWLALYGRRPAQAVMLFLVFGFLMTVAWIRLSAPDPALAEAAVGAGVTGVLLILLLSRLRKEKPDD